MLRRERFVYVIAFEGDEFVMVKHKTRKWEMPGGRLRENESFEQGAKREFVEETGMEMKVIGEIPIEQDGGKVFVGLVTRHTRRTLSGEISDVRTFRKLPNDLSFPLVEYKTMLDQAKRIAETFKNRKAIGRTASPLTGRNRRR